MKYLKVLIATLCFFIATSGFTGCTALKKGLSTKEDGMIEDMQYGKENTNEECIVIESFDYDGELITVGSDVAGYVELPAHYYLSYEKEEEQTLRYIDKPDSTVVLLMTYYPINSDLEASAASSADYFYEGYKRADLYPEIDQASVSKTKVKIAGKEGYMVTYRDSETGTWYTVSLVPCPSDETLRSVWVTYPPEHEYLLDMVISTYRFEK